MAINSGIAKNKDIYPSPDLGGGTRPRDGTTGVQATTENEFAIWRKVERGEGWGHHNRRGERLGQGREPITELPTRAPGCAGKARALELSLRARLPYIRHETLRTSRP